MDDLTHFLRTHPPFDSVVRAGRCAGRRDTLVYRSHGPR
jgi:hypothetical protein